MPVADSHAMEHNTYTCLNCGRELSYQTTKHNGCASCGFLPRHGAD